MEAVLSNTEREVLELRIKGFSRKEIAKKTFRSENTIKTHFQNIQLKTGIRNEVDIAVWYIEEVLKIEIKKLLKVTVALALLFVAEFADSDMIRARRVRSRSRTCRTTRSRKSKNNENYYWS